MSDFDLDIAYDLFQCERLVRYSLNSTTFLPFA